MHRLPPPPPASFPVLSIHPLPRKPSCLSQDLEAEQEILETILPLARLGSSVTLVDGRTSALLGEFPTVQEGIREGVGYGITEGGVGGERCSSRGRYVVVDLSGKVEAVLPSQVWIEFDFFYISVCSVMLFVVVFFMFYPVMKRCPMHVCVCVCGQSRRF